MLDFPASPTNGQKYPTTSISGVPTYTWDGEKWVTVTNVSGGGGGGGGSSSIIISDTPPTGVPDGTLWWESDSGLLYIRYNDGTSTQWVIAAPQPDVNAFVQYGVQTPTVAQQTQARQNVYAAPFDALAYNGMQVNGSMNVSQQNGTSVITVTAPETSILDGWSIAYAKTGAVITGQQAGNLGIGANGLQTILLKATTAVTAPSGNDYVVIRQRLEGYRINRLGFGGASASPITIGFWVSSTTGGTMCVSLHNGAINRNIVTNVTLTAGAWEWRTITLPGDTLGAWDTSGGIGFYLDFCCAVGTGFVTATPDIWASTFVVATSAQTNFLGTNNNTVYIGGVIVLPGIEVPTAARSAYIMRPFDQELLLCKRYWNYGATYADTWVTAGQTYVSEMIYFGQPMRTAPTIKITVTSSSANLNLPANVAPLGIHSAELYFFCNAAGNAGFATTWTADARL